MGLERVEHIGNIVVDPRDSNVVWVAAQGPLWRSGGDRGLYRTTDGGATWERVLHISDDTGIAEVKLHPEDPDTILASAYQRRRHTWTLINGGPESGLHKSTDGGKTWREITAGLPSVDKGRMGLCFSPVEPDVVYGVLDAALDEGGTFRSTDRGETWEKRSDHAPGGDYYNEFICDPGERRSGLLHGHLDAGHPRRRQDLRTCRRDPQARGQPRPVDQPRTTRATFAPVATAGSTSPSTAAPPGSISRTCRSCSSTGPPSTTPSPSTTSTAAPRTTPPWADRPGRGSGRGSPTRTGSSPSSATDSKRSSIPRSPTSSTASGSTAGWFATTGPPVRPSTSSPSRRRVRNPTDGIGMRPSSSARTRTPGSTSPPRSSSAPMTGATPGTRSPRTSRGASTGTQLEVMGRVWGADAVHKSGSTSVYGNAVALTESPLVEGLIYVGTDDGQIHITSDGGETWRIEGRLPRRARKHLCRRARGLAARCRHGLRHLRQPQTG